MKITEYNEYRSGRQAVFNFLSENKYLTFGTVKQKLVESTSFGGLKDQTIRNYMSEWHNNYSKSGMVPNLHRGFGGLESGFDISLWEKAPEFGWRISQNKNQERLHSESEVSLGWHRNGTVVFRFKGFRPEGHLLNAFVRSFLDVIISTGLSDSEAVNYLQALFKKKYHTTDRHSAFDTGQLLPKIKIRDFKKSHGIVINLGDGSHPSSVEVEQTEPFWFSKIEQIIDKFGLQIDSHLALVNSWREESVENKRVLQELHQNLKLQNSIIIQLTSKLPDVFFQLPKGDQSNGQ